MIEFNFKSQICTTREQSERLLSLGLKKETADMVLLKEMVYDEENHCTRDGEGYLIRPIDYLEGEEHRGHIPAWSLHRLIEMMPNEIRKYDAWANLSINNELVQYAYYDIDYNHGTCLEHFNDGTLFDNICDAYEWLIKEGYFNEEYLEE